MKNGRDKTSTRVLVFHIGSLGDTIVSIPALRAVRRHFGRATEITLLHNIQPGVPVQPKDVLSGTALVDRYIGYRFSGGNRLRRVVTMAQLGARLRRQGFEFVVSLLPAERGGEALARDRKFFRWCGINQQLGFTPFPPELFTARTEDGHAAEVQHEARFRMERLERDGVEIQPEIDLAPPFVVIPDVEAKAADDWLRRERQYRERPLVAIAPGSQMPAKDWPLERFEELGWKLVDLDRYELIVLGGAAEKELGDQLVRHWGTGLNAAGSFSVMGSGALLSRCAFIFGLDTGTAHLAAALGIPGLSLFSERANPGQWYPLGSGQVVLYHRVPCSGCRTVNCPVEGHPCMTGISIAAVWAELERRLAEGASREAKLAVIEV